MNILDLYEECDGFLWLKNEMKQYFIVSEIPEPPGLYFIYGKDPRYLCPICVKRISEDFPLLILLEDVTFN
jgi:hypothetical protein